MNIRTLAASATLAFAASAAWAQTEGAPILLTLTPTGPNTSAVTFERSVNGLFLDTFTFAPSSFAGTVSVSLMPLSGTISFFASLLNNQGFSFFPESGQSIFAFQAEVTADTPLSLQVFGYAGDVDTLTASNGAYRGTITAFDAVTPIPEPETYALMLAGLAALGVLNRRVRRRR